MNHEDALRQALRAEAAAVEVRPDALDEIRRRIRRRRPPWSLALGGGAVAAMAGGAAAVALVAGPGQAPTVTPSPGPAHSAPSSPGPAVPTTPPGPPPGTSPPAATTAGPDDVGVRASLAVYFVGVDRSAAAGGARGRPRLYREFHQLPAGDGSPAARTRAAVTAMLDRDAAADPDYVGAWPAGARVADVRVGAGVVTVDLAGAGAAGSTVLAVERARVVVQQLVWTVTAASGEPGVRLLLDGRPAGVLWGHAQAGGVLRRAPLVDVVAPVWLIGPQHGDVVGREVTVHVAGVVFEATAHLRVREGSRVVLERVLTLSVGAPAQGEIKLTVTLPPGTYVFEAYELSALDGSEQHLDDHLVTVR